MAGTAYPLEIVTPDGKVFEGTVTSAVVPSVDGSFGILARHAPILAAVAAGKLRVDSDRGKLVFAIGDGFVEVVGGETRILTDFALEPERIDVSRARAARDRAQERLRQKAEDLDRARAEAALRRAMCMIRIAQD